MSDLPLAALRLSPAAEADLRWYLCDAEGALGLRSNFGAQLDRALAAGGRNRGSKPLGAAVAAGVSDEQLAAVERARRVRARLATLPAPLRATLVAAFGPGLPRVPRRDWSWLETPTLSVTLLLLVASRKRLTRAALAALKGSPKADDRARLEALRAAASMALIQAGQVYQDAGRTRRPRASVEAG